MTKRFRTNYESDPVIDPRNDGENMTIPGQSVSITEVIYRFQGGIIPSAVTAYFDPVDDENYIDVRNQSGFDITDAFHALQDSKEKYKKYITEKNQAARAAIEAQRVEMARLRKLEQEAIEKEKFNQKNEL